MVLPTQLNKEGLCKVYVEVIKWERDNSGNFRKKIKRFSSDIWVLPSSMKKQEVLTKDNDYTIKNSTINNLYNKINTTINIQDSNPYHSLDGDITELSKLFDHKIINKDLISYLKEYIEYRISRNDKRGTVKEFTTLKNRLINYELYTGKRLFFTDMNLNFSDNHYIWLNDNNYHKHTIYKHFEILKTFLNYYYVRRNELNINTLDDSFLRKEFKKGNNSSTPPKPLTREEFKILTNTTINNERLEKTRKLAILQCSTGLRYSDLFRINPNNIINDSIEISPVKTEHKANNTIYIPLNQHSKEILKSFNYSTVQYNISNQKYNENLKDMFNFIGITSKYTSHNLRDTFITFSIEKGVDIPTLLQWTGQSDYKVMKKYIKLTEKHLKDKMKQVF
jgi:site-specific recombinase XerD